MEKFMYIFVDHGVSTASPEELQASMQKWFDWVNKFRTEERYVSGEPLLPEGRVVKRVGKTITDGPYTESKEIVSGFIVIYAKDLEEATQLSKDCPIFDSNDGWVAVRPVQALG